MQVLEIGNSHCLTGGGGGGRKGGRCGEIVYTHYIVQIMVYTSTRFLAHNVVPYLHCLAHLAVHIMDTSNVGTPPCLSLM